MISLMVVARLIGREQFGELGIIQSSIGMFQVFAAFGMGVTATKHVAVYRHTNPERAGRIIMLTALFSSATGTCMALVLWLFSPWLSTSILNAPQLVIPLRISALMLIFSGWTSAQTGSLAGFEAFRTIARINFFVGLSSMPVIIVGALWGGVKGAVWGLVITMAINAIFNNLALRARMHKEGIPATLDGWYNELQMLWKFTLPAVLGGAMVPPVNWLGTAMLVRQPNGFAEMGIFAAANQWFSVLLFLPSMINSTILPILAETAGARDFSKLKKILFLGIKISFICVIPFAGVIAILSPYIMSCYGAVFQEGWPVLIMISMAAIVAGIQNLFGNTLASINRMWLHFIMNLIWATLFLTILLLLLHSGWGALGIATAQFASYMGRFCIVIIILFILFKGANGNKAFFNK